MRPIVVVVMVVAAANAFAFRLDLAGTWKFWAGLGIPSALLAAWALHTLRASGKLIKVLTPRWGDLSLGFVTAAVLLGASLTARSALGATGTERPLGCLRPYGPEGDADAVQL